MDLDIKVDKSIGEDRKFGPKWAKDRGMVPGYGGIWPGKKANNIFMHSYVHPLCANRANEYAHLIFMIIAYVNTGDPNAPKFDVKIAVD